MAYKIKGYYIKDSGYSELKIKGFKEVLSVKENNDSLAFDHPFMAWIVIDDESESKNLLKVYVVDSHEEFDYCPEKWIYFNTIIAGNFSSYHIFIDSTVYTPIDIKIKDEFKNMSVEETSEILNKELFDGLKGKSSEEIKECLKERRTDK